MNQGPGIAGYKEGDIESIETLWDGDKSRDETGRIFFARSQSATKMLKYQGQRRCRGAIHNLPFQMSGGGWLK